MRYVYLFYFMLAAFLAGSWAYVLVQAMRQGVYEIHEPVKWIILTEIALACALGVLGVICFFVYLVRRK